MRTTTKLLLGFISIILFLTYVSCKKSDFIQNTETVSKNSIEEKFFNTNRTTDPIENALIDFLKRVNTKDSFVEKTAKQIGYPRWDKAITNAMKKGASVARNLLGDSTQTYYIPFVRDSQNFVNASMVIHVSQTDTSFTYRCDWQYAQFVNDSTTANDQAENVASFFMALDNVVFGHTQFKITDKRLFKPLSNIHANDTGDYIIKKAIITDSINTPSNNLLAYECTDIVIFYECSICYGNDPDCPLGGTWYEYHRFCDWTYYPDNGGGGGGGGTGGGGGGGGGGSTPPPCDQQPVASFAGHNNLVEPCSGGGGWIPVPDDDIPPTPYFDYSHLDNPIFVDDVTVQMPLGFNFQFQGFNAVTDPPIKIIGKTTPRNNTEDMEWGNNCNASGILSNMPNFTDQQLFDEVEDLLHKTSTGILETAGDNMITRFRNNLGGTYSNADLSQKVFENSKFKEFIIKFGVRLNQALENANWNIDNVNTIDIPSEERPIFNGLHNKFNGLQILINDTEETIVELTGFSINATTHKWTANLNIIIKDHFGLDKNDALTYQNNHAGFAAWWILQHCRGYKPFETQVKFKMDLVAE